MKSVTRRQALQGAIAVAVASALPQVSKKELQINPELLRSAIDVLDDEHPPLTDHYAKTFLDAFEAESTANRLLMTTAPKGGRFTINLRF